MLKLSLILTALLIAGINSDKFDAFRSKYSENQFSSGKHRHSNDKNDEFIPFKPELQANGQPLPSPCTGFRVKIKIPHPLDKAKYIQCRDEFHYDVFTCPTGTQYNADVGACRTFVQIKDRCDEEKPCLNDGVCSIVSNSTLKCTCGADWSGDRCEIPVNSCVMKPCGPTGECRTLKTTDSEQDYICLCRGRKEYGYTCQDVVPSPCISGEEIFFPFAFSTRAYIQCDGELIYFQSCGSLLYWNQEEKYCDRKRTHTIDASAISSKPAPTTDNESAQSSMVNDDSEELTTLPPTKSTKVITRAPEPIRQPIQRSRIDSEPTINFIPNQNINRRPIAIEGPAPVNKFADQRFQDNQVMVRPTFEAPLPETATRNLPIEPKNEDIPMRPWQNPSRSDRLRVEQQFRFTTTTTSAPIADSNVAQSFMRGESFLQQPPRFNANQQRFPEPINVDRVPAVTNEERFPPVFSNRFRGEPSFAPTTTTTWAPPIRENSFEPSSMREDAPVQQQQKQRFNPNQQRFPEPTNVDRVPAVTNEERFPPIVVNRFRGEPSFPSTFTTTITTTTTTTLAPMIKETIADSAPGEEEEHPVQPWFHKFNLQSSTQPTFQNGLIEPTTLAANIIRGPNVPVVNNEEEEFARETSTPPSFHTRPWPNTNFANPSWRPRQKQPSPTIDSSLLSASGVRKSEPTPIGNEETWSTSTETMSFNQQNPQRLPNVNSFETNNLSNDFSPRRGMSNQNQIRQYEQNMPSQSGHWKARY